MTAYGVPGTVHGMWPGAGERCAAGYVVPMVIHGPIDQADVAGLCARARRLLAGGADVLVCDVSDLTEPDLCTIDALARLRLTAGRLGRRLRLRQVPPELRALLGLTGFAELFPPYPEDRVRPLPTNLRGPVRSRPMRGTNQGPAEGRGTWSRGSP